MIVSHVMISTCCNCQPGALIAGASARPKVKHGKINEPEISESVIRSIGGKKLPCEVWKASVGVKESELGWYAHMHRYIHMFGCTQVQKLLCYYSVKTVHISLAMCVCIFMAWNCEQDAYSYVNHASAYESGYAPIYITTNMSLPSYPDRAV